MPDEEWIKKLEDGRKVKFIYQELPEDGAFITAQIAGNEIVYSVVLTKSSSIRIFRASMNFMNRSERSCSS